VTLGIRPETVTLADGEGHSCLDAVIGVLEPTGRHHGRGFRARASGDSPVKAGGSAECGPSVRLAMDMSRASLSDPATELRVA
jgi:hypothetical protein